MARARFGRWRVAALVAALPVAAAAGAQAMPGMAMPPPAGHAGHEHGASPPPADPGAAQPGGMAGHDMAGHGMAGMGSMDMTRGAMLGRYPMTREGSGTSWQPDSTPMRGRMFDAGGWTLMAEGYATGIHDDQGGARGDAKTYSTSMAMLMAGRDVSASDRVGLRAMLSLDPAMGRSGYPLLFATGETADGRTHLIDRQHPHDLFMELAASWSHSFGPGTAASLYAGLPGEPALGPPTFMHRPSAWYIPEAPIGHHWFDSTHITFGVVTAGLSSGPFRVEASGFKGREPDQHRWDIETPKLDSWALRAFWNPTANLSLQLSTGHLHSPEQLEPELDEQRTTASATWVLPLGGRRSLASTVAWSNKDERPGPALTGLLAETTLKLGRHELFARAEREEENELFDEGRNSGRIFRVTKVSLGYQHELPVADHIFLALGALGSAYDYPDTLVATYGRRGVKSFMVYGRVRFGT